MFYAKLCVPYFYRATLCVSAVFAVSRCPSVRLSVHLPVTFVDCIQMAEDIIKLLSRPDSPIILTLSADTKFQGEPLQQGRKVHWGGEILRFSTEIAVYLRNGTR